MQLRHAFETIRSSFGQRKLQKSSLESESIHLCARGFAAVTKIFDRRIRAALSHFSSLRIGQSKAERAIQKLFSSLKFKVHLAFTTLRLTVNHKDDMDTLSSMKNSSLMLLGEMMVSKLGEEDSIIRKTAMQQLVSSCKTLLHVHFIKLACFRRDLEAKTPTHAFTQIVADSHSLSPTHTFLSTQPQLSAVMLPHISVHHSTLASSVDSRASKKTKQFGILFRIVVQIAKQRYASSLNQMRLYGCESKIEQAVLLNDINLDRIQELHQRIAKEKLTGGLQTIRKLANRRLTDAFEEIRCAELNPPQIDYQQICDDSLQFEFSLSYRLTLLRNITTLNKLITRLAAKRMHEAVFARDSCFQLNINIESN